MSKTIYLLFALSATVAATPAISAENRWFWLFSTGTASSSGPFEMSNFYDPTFAASVELGYDLTDYLAIVPINCMFHDFEFTQQEFINNFWNYWGEYNRLVWEDIFNRGYGGLFSGRSLLALSISDDVFSDIEATSSLTGFSYAPGIQFKMPLRSGFSSSLFVGAGIYSTRVSMTRQFTYVNPSSGEITNHYTYRDRTRITHFTTLFGAGVEYMLANRMGINFRINYHRIFTGRNSDTSFNFNIEALKFYRLEQDGLRYHRFLEEKDTGILEFSAGLRILMY